jgi:CubicO group peptidase (beta-lactamase class C family)
MMMVHPRAVGVVAASIAIAELLVAGTLGHAVPGSDAPVHPVRLVLMDHAREIDSLVAPLVHDAGPGVCVLVMQHDSVLFSRAYGLADVEARQPITTRTNFRLASVTKQFTATAIVLLAREGKLSLDVPVRTYLPELPACAAPVTLRHLLTHTSGLVAYEDVMPDSQSVQLHDRDVLTLLEHVDSTYFIPGSAYRYSNSGYAVLALVVERVSGMSFSRFLKERMFVPLGMNRTVAFEEGKNSVGERAYGYSERSFLWFHWYTRTDQSLTSAVLGDGGIYSSVEDLRKWYRSLETAELVGPAWQKQIETTAILPDGHPVGYGLGWEVQEYHGMPSLAHGGSSIGFSHAVRRIPADGFTAILLTNQNSVRAFTVLDRVVDLWYSPPTGGSPNPPPRR